jgi:hypothetical protein
MFVPHRKHACGPPWLHCFILLLFTWGRRHAEEPAGVSPVPALAVPITAASHHWKQQSSYQIQDIWPRLYYLSSFLRLRDMSGIYNIAGSSCVVSPPPSPLLPVISSCSYILNYCIGFYDVWKYFPQSGYEPDIASTTDWWEIPYRLQNIRTRHLAGAKFLRNVGSYKSHTA